MTFDRSLDTVECDICGEKLNPMDVLERFANSEKTALSELLHEKKLLDVLSKKLFEKCRTKCAHCEKMTPININMSELDWRNFK
jgi:hypothetical protein